MAKFASIGEASTGLTAVQMLEQLLSDHESLARTCRTALLAALESQDEATADLLVRRLGVHEKTAWMLRAQLAP